MSLTVPVSGHRSAELQHEGGPLQRAAYKGDCCAIARLLESGLESGLCPDELDANGQSALCAAIDNAYGHEEVVYLLLHCDANLVCCTVNLVNPCNGSTALMTAAHRGHRRILLLLLEHGADLNSRTPNHWLTAFHLACASGQAECAVELVKAGSDTRQRHKRGCTGKQLASENGHTGVIDALRALAMQQIREEQPAVPEPCVGNTVATADPRNDSKSSLSTCDKVPEEKKTTGERVDAAELHAAAASGDCTRLRKLLENADVNTLVTFAEYGKGKIMQTTSLSVAVANGRSEAVRVLLDLGVDPTLATTSNQGVTPLMMAAVRGSPGILLDILGRLPHRDHLDVQEPVEYRSAFHLACWRGHTVCAIELAKAGCNIALRDIYGETGMQAAMAKGHNLVVRSLKSLAEGQMLPTAPTDDQETASKSRPTVKMAPEYHEYHPEHQLRQELFDSLSIQWDDIAALSSSVDTEKATEKCLGEIFKLCKIKLLDDAQKHREELHAAAHRGDCAALTELLSQPGAEVNALQHVHTTNAKGVHASVLLAAINARQEQAVELLLAAGADPNLADTTGISPLMTAAGINSVAMVEMLLKHGGDEALNATEPGQKLTAFHIACSEDSTECALLLAERGADVGLRCAHGITGVEIAFARRNKALTKGLKVQLKKAAKLRSSAATKAQLARPCAVCGAAAKQCCSRCKGASYCGVKCQKTAWKTHKHGCIKFD